MYNNKYIYIYIYIRDINKIEYGISRTTVSKFTIPHIWLKNPLQLSKTFADLALHCNDSESKMHASLCILRQI